MVGPWQGASYLSEPTPTARQSSNVQTITGVRLRFEGHPPHAPFLNAADRAKYEMYCRAGATTML
jgi:hypothetical protein